MHNDSITGDDLYRDLFNRVPIGLYRTSPEGKIIEANPALVEMLGYPNRGSLINTDIKDIYVKTDTREKELFLLRENDIVINHRIQLYRYDNRIIYVKDTARSIKDKNNVVLYYEGSLEDITERVKAEEALRESEQNLRTINAEKDKFFSIIAHDLINSFNSMIGFSDILTERFDTFNPGTQKEYLQVIHQSILNSYKLLENLLLWSRSQSGVIEFDPEHFNLYALVNDALELLKQAAHKKLILLLNKVPETSTVYADKNMVLSILRNLINNAIKFTPQNGKISVSAEPIQIEGKKMIEVCVNDTGIGIAEEKQKKLFNIYENVSSKGTDNEPGTGLGLILCKDFVERHNGEIRVKSKPGEGSSLIFTLPAQAP